MIALIQSIPAGNALRVLLQPPSAATRIRLLRKEVNAFPGWDDADAVVISDGMERCVTDAVGLINGVTFWYCAFYLINGVWSASIPKFATPAASFVDIGADPLTVVRDRLELGLKVFVERGQISHERGFLPTLLASPMVDQVPLPVVTVHLSNDSPDMRAVGELVATETFNPDTGEWSSFEGGLSRTDLTIVGWSLNSDERIAIRNAIKAVLQANLPIFDSAGLLLVSWNFSDTEDFETYQAPVYQVVCQFTCYALSAIEGSDPALSNVIVNNLGYTNG